MPTSGYLEPEGMSDAMQEYSPDTCFHTCS